MTPDEVIAEYQVALAQCRQNYLGKWVRRKKKNTNCVSPGLVEDVRMSHRRAVCTIRWANNYISTEGQDKIELL